MFSNIRSKLICCEGLFACKGNSQHPPAAPKSLTAEPFYQAKVSISVPAKPQGKTAGTKCQLINERVYLRNKQGTRIAAAALPTLPLPTPC